MATQCWNLGAQEAARSFQNAVGEAEDAVAAWNLLLCRCLLGDGEAAKEAFLRLMLVCTVSAVCLART